VSCANADKRFLEVVHAFLRELGHETETAADGLECLTALREFGPHVVVLDHGLLWGGSDGVISHMREAPDYSDVPVIVVADKGRPEQLAALRDSPGVQWLHRPFWLPELLTRINAVGRPEECSKAEEAFAEAG